jgi:hypothetical protein
MTSCLFIKNIKNCTKLSKSISKTNLVSYDIQVLELKIGMVLLEVIQIMSNIKNSHSRHSHINKNKINVHDAKKQFVNLLLVHADIMHSMVIHFSPSGKLCNFSAYTIIIA